MNSKLFLLLPCLLLASCASIMSKANWPVALNSNPSGAKVVVKNDDGTVVYQGMTPSSVVLASSPRYFRPARYAVEFSKKGYPTQTIPLTANVNGWYMGNIVVGLMGFLVVDPLTGAMYRLDDNVTANLSPLATLEGGNGKKLQIVDRSSLPADVQKKLVAVN